MRRFLYVDDNGNIITVLFRVQILLYKWSSIINGKHLLDTQVLRDRGQPVSIALVQPFRGNFAHLSRAVNCPYGI